MRHNNGHFKPAGQDPRRGKGGARLGAGRKSKDEHWIRNEVQRRLEEFLSKYATGVVETALKVCRGIRRKKFNAKGEPIIDPDTGKQYFELEYDSAMIRFWIDRFVPAARAGVTMAESTPEEFWRALEEARRREAEEKATIEVKEPDTKKVHDEHGACHQR
jgi:hypothetical protein